MLKLYLLFDLKQIVQLLEFLAVFRLLLRFHWV